MVGDCFEESNGIGVFNIKNRAPADLLQPIVSIHGVKIGKGGGIVGGDQVIELEDNCEDIGEALPDDGGIGINIRLTPALDNIAAASRSAVTQMFSDQVVVFFAVLKVQDTQPHCKVFLKVDAGLRDEEVEGPDEDGEDKADEGKDGNEEAEEVEKVADGSPAEEEDDEGDQGGDSRNRNAGYEEGAKILVELFDFGDSLNMVIYTPEYLL